VVTNGNYQFSVASDDGAMLKVNGQMVLDLNAPGTYRTASGALTLPAGSFPIELDYFQQGGAAGLDFTVTGPGPTSLTTNTTVHDRVASGGRLCCLRVCRRGGFPMGLTYTDGVSFGDSLLVGDGTSVGALVAVLAFMPRRFQGNLPIRSRLDCLGGGRRAQLRWRSVCGGRFIMDATCPAPAIAPEPSSFMRFKRSDLRSRLPGLGRSRP